MKSLSKFASIATGVTILAFVTFSIAPAVLADSPGQIEGGNIYQIENLTQKTTFSNPATANACDEVEYSVRLHNPDYDQLTNVTVAVTLPTTSGTSVVSTLTANSAVGDPTTTTATATLNLTTAQSVSYVNGTSELLNSNGTLIENLPDGITAQNGINIGSLAGSATEYVNFEVKVGGCTTPTPPVSPTTPTTLVNTGPGDVLGIFAGASILSAFAHRLFKNRQVARSNR